MLKHIVDQEDIDKLAEDLETEEDIMKLFIEEEDEDNDDVDLFV